MDYKSIAVPAKAVNNAIKIVINSSNSGHVAGRPVSGQLWPRIKRNG